MKTTVEKVINRVQEGKQWRRAIARNTIPLQRIVPVLIIAIILSATTACNSGGDSKPQNYTYSGSVVAPGGAIAALQQKTWKNVALSWLLGKELQASISGLTAVPDATVELIKIDNDGNQVGNVIASTMTDGSGNFSFTSTTAPASNLVVRVSGASETERAFAIGDSLIISPASEYLVQQILLTVSADSSMNLANFNTTELGLLTDYVNGLSVVVVPGSVANAVGAIKSAAITAGMDSQIALYSPDGLSLAGNWDYREYTGSNTCGDTVGVLWSEVLLTITQSGTSLTVTSGGDQIAKLRLSGYDLLDIPLTTYPDQGGTTTETAMTLTVKPDGLSINGEIKWNWTNGSFSCSGKSAVLMSRQ